MTWIALWLGLIGCVTLAPHERGLLLTPVMGDPRDAAFEVHVHDVREGMAGATPGGGASCGCN